MTNEQIKKALECCAEWIGCESCPYFGRYRKKCTSGRLHTDALNLIAEQEKEIEQLKAENKVWSTQVYQAYDNGYKDGYDSIEEDIIQDKIDVLTELKEKYGFYSCYSWNCDVKSLSEIIDEMIEELKK